MSALVCQIADAVVAELNGPARSWAPKINAKRDWMLVKEGDELRDLTVSVATVGKQRKKLIRNRSQFDFQVAINFQQRLDANDTAAVDDLVQLIESVCSWFDNDNGDEPGKHLLVDLPNWQVSDWQNDPVYEHDLLHAQNEFESLILLTVTGLSQ